MKVKFFFTGMLLGVCIITGRVWGQQVQLPRCDRFAEGIELVGNGKFVISTDKINGVLPDTVYKISFDMKKDSGCKGKCNVSVYKSIRDEIIKKEIGTNHIAFGEIGDEIPADGQWHKTEGYFKTLEREDATDFLSISFYNSNAEIGSKAELKNLKLEILKPEGLPKMKVTCPVLQNGYELKGDGSGNIRINASIKNLLQNSRYKISFELKKQFGCKRGGSKFALLSSDKKKGQRTIFEESTNIEGDNQWYKTENNFKTGNIMDKPHIFISMFNNGSDPGSKVIIKDLKIEWQGFIEENSKIKIENKNNEENNNEENNNEVK